MQSETRINHPEGCHTVCRISKALRNVSLQNGVARRLIKVGMNVGMQLVDEHGHEVCAMAIDRECGDDVEVDTVVGG